MSDDTFPDDELVSAVLDGEATAEEAARVRSDPALQARLEEFRSVAEQVGTPRVLLSPARDEHLARAMVEADTWAAGAVAPPIDLDTARRQRTRTAAIVSIAAVIGVLLVGLAVVRVVTREDEPQTTATGEPQEEEQFDDEGGERATSDEDTAEVPEAAAGAPDAGDQSQGLDAETSIAEEVIDLGSFESRAELQNAVTGAVDQYLADESGFEADGVFAPGASAELQRGSPRAECSATIVENDREINLLLWSADAELDGVPLHLFLYDTQPGSAANGRLRLYAIDQTTCEPIADGVQTFSP